MPTLEERMKGGNVKEINHRWHYWVKVHERNGKKVKSYWRKFPWEI